MSSAMKAVSRMWLRAARSARDLWEDRGAIAATEFAVIVPVMLVLFFGVVEFSSAVAVDRKVTIMARTLSDLTSQSPPAGVADTDFTNYFNAGNGIMQPYVPVNGYPSVRATISELFIDPNTLQARVQWSKSTTGTTPRATSSIVTIPAGLAVGNTYLIYSEVSFLYTPTIGYVMKAGVNLSDVAYTRPRQSVCVIYPASTNGTTPPCPTL
jgi:Flp pilus assembly protein TadG